MADRLSVPRRVLVTLMASQILFSAGYVTVVAVMGLLAADLTGNDLWAGVPNAALTIGIALAAGPLSRRAARAGRRPALWAGYLVGAVGAGFGLWAGQTGSFPALLAALLVVGSGQAAALQSRFAAADLASPTERARAISLVVWVGAIGGVVGPSFGSFINNVGLSVGLRQWVAPLGAAMVLFTLSALVVAVGLRPDPLEGRKPPSTRRSSVWSSWGVVRARPLALLGIASLGLSQAAMVAVMTMTPLHMRDHGQADLSGVVISVHILGMFGLAPLVGLLVDRIGPIGAIRLGAMILGGGVLISVVAGYQPVLIFVGLFLLGLGWSFGLIAGSTLLVGAVGDEHRVPVQGMADAILSLLGGGAALASGFIKQGVGFHWLANLAFALALVVLIAAVRLRPASVTPA